MELVDGRSEFVTESQCIICAENKLMLRRYISTPFVGFGCNVVKAFNFLEYILRHVLTCVEKIEISTARHHWQTKYDIWILTLQLTPSNDFRWLDLSYCPLSTVAKTQFTPCQPTHVLVIILAHYSRDPLDVAGICICTVHTSKMQLKILPVPLNWKKIVLQLFEGI